MMSRFNSSETLQTPLLTPSSTSLSLPPDIDQAGLFDNGRLSWATSNGTVYITDTKSGACFQNWVTVNHTITHVAELKRHHKGQRSLLVIVLEGNGQHILGVLSSLGVKLIRAIVIPDAITYIHPFSYDGFPPSRELAGFSRPDLFPESVLSLFNGIVAVGTHKGCVYLVDLQLGATPDSVISSCLANPSTLHVIEGPVSVADIKSISETCHVTVDISKESFHKGRFVYQKLTLSPASLSVTAILYAPQIVSLFVGYSFGCFQIYNVSTFQLLYSSPLLTQSTSTLPPVTHFTYIEPENDPRMFLYVWVVRGKSRFVREGSTTETKASLQQMIFSEKTPPTNRSDHALYRGFQGCGARLEYAFTPTPALPNPLSSPGSHVIHCSTLVRHHRQQGSHLDVGHEIDLSTAVFVWSAGDVNSTDIFIGLFDVNQWYQAQMPNVVRWKRSGKYTGVFGCSYFSFYSLQQASVNTGRMIDAVIDSFLPFHSHPPMPEIFMWPSASQFSVKGLSPVSVMSCEFLGVQRMALHELDVCRGSLFAQPERLFQLCAKAELLPPMWDHSSSVLYQKAALLNVIVNHGCPTRILTAFADSWIGAGRDDPVISQWVELKKADLVHVKESICESVFACSPPLISPSTHWRKMAAVQVLLERLLSHGFDQEGKTSSVYEGVADLYCTITLHKKVMEVLVFLNEHGLINDYPAAALKRRYDMLRGMGEQTNKLAVDYLMEDLHGNSEEGVYPPPALSSFLNIFMSPNLLHQHCLMIYLLCDLGSLGTDGPFSLPVAYASVQDIPNSIATNIQGLWILDNRKHRDPVYKHNTSLLFRKADNRALFPWQHSVVTASLLMCGEVCLALDYLQVHRGEMQGAEEIKLKLSVFVSNLLVSGAYETLRQYEGSEFYDDLFTFFLECCIEAKCLQLLIDLPLSTKAELMLVTSLEQHPTLACRELLVFYFLSRHRIVEAKAMHEKIKPFAKSDPDPKAMHRCSQRDALLFGLGTIIPNDLHHVQLSSEGKGGQGSKLKVQVDKSLSSVVAKTMLSGTVGTKGGVIYSLIQSIAEKRSASNEPFTPFKCGKGSITELSQAPFLSTPVSVRKLRAHPSTAQRLHSLVTPTPRSRPATPVISHTHQRFVSHIQSFRDRMTSMLSQSGTTNLGVSPVQFPSPVSSVLLAKPLLDVATPQSILKGKKVETRLTTDKRIRFAVEGTPLPDVGARQRPQVFTPAVASSLSTTSAVAMTTPLPSSDDSDIFESPVESPSQLMPPETTSLLQTSTEHLSPAIKLQFMEEDDNPQIEREGLAGGEREGLAGEEDRMEESVGSFVVDQVSGNGTETVNDIHRRDNDIHEESIVEEESSGEEMEETKSVSPPLKGWMEKLTRDSLTSSVSLRITPVSKPPVTHILSSSTASSLFSSPVTSVSMTTKPGSSLFSSPVTSVSMTTKPGSSLFSSPVTSVSMTTKPGSSLFPSPVTSVSMTTKPGSSLFSSPVTSVSMTTKPGSSQLSMTTKPGSSLLFSPIPYLSDLLQAKKEKVQTYFEAQKQRDVSALKTTFSTSQADNVSLTTQISRDNTGQKDSTVSKFSATMVQSTSTSTLASSVATPTTDQQYSFTPPTRVLSDAYPHPMLDESDPISFAFSPPLTRSAARRRHGDSQSREGSVEPISQTQPKKHGRRRPRKTVLPPTDDSVMLVTPPTVPHPSRGPTGRQERKAKAVKSGVGNRRSARLLTGKK